MYTTKIDICISHDIYQQLLMLFNNVVLSSVHKLLKAFKSSPVMLSVLGDLFFFLGSRECRINTWALVAWVDDGLWLERAGGRGLI